MSLLGTWFKRLRKPSRFNKRARRLFLEPLEGRQLLAVDLETIKQIDPSTPTAVAGQEFRYTITLTNLDQNTPQPDGEAAVDVVLQDVIPVNTTYVNLIAPDGWTVIPPATGAAGEAVTATIASLAPDSVQTFTLILNVLPGARGTITNEAGASTRSVENFLPNDSSRVENTPIEVRADLSIVKDDGMISVPAGGAVTYTITVTNAGPSNVIGASIIDVFPATLSGVTFTSVAQGGATGNTNDAGNINNTVDMPVGSSIIYTVNATAGASGTITNTADVTVPGGTIDPNTGNNSSTDNTTIISSGPTTDLTIVKTNNTTTEVPGTQTQYTITVTNAGLEAVTGARVTDTFPAALFAAVSYTSAATGSATGNTAQGTTGIDDTVNMPAGSTIVYTVTATIQRNATGELSNTARVEVPAGTNDSDPANNSSTDTDTLNPEADLSISKTESPAATSSIPGNQTTYTIVVRNDTGPSDIIGATVLDVFSNQYAFVSYASTATGATGNTATGSGDINDTVNLPVGSSVTYTVTATISPAARGSLTNTARVNLPANATDPAPGNNVSTDQNTLTPRADLSIVKSNTTDTVTAGGQITYTIVVSNTGPSSVTGATVTDTFDPRLTNVTYTSAVTAGTASGNTAVGASNINDAVNLGVGSSITYNVTATVSPAASGVINNTARVTAPQDVTDAAQGNNADSETDSVPAVDVAVTKDDNLVGPVTAGDTISYTITVSNPGTIPVAGLVLTDTVPTGTTLVSFTPPANWTRADNVPGQVRATRSGALAPNGSEIFTLVVRVDASVANNSNINNTAQVTTTTPGDINSGNNNDPETTLVQTRADLSVTKSDSPADSVGAGGLITYTIIVTNAGPSNAQGATLIDAIPAGTNFQSFTAPAGWNFTPPPANGTGTITATNSSFAPGTATFTLIVRANSTLTSGATITNTASVSSTGTTDPNLGNNSDSETTGVIVPPDFGDAPNSYGTLSVNNGPRHGGGALRLGALLDAELDGQPSPTATGDDANGIDDEDGVTVPGALIVNRAAAVLVNSSGSGRLDAWIDFNRNGVFDASEQIATSLPVSAGSNTVFVAVPADAVTGGTFARFRLSSAGGLAPTGIAPDGEVEDYATSIIVVTPGTVGIVPDPEQPGQNMLLIVGTDASENISVTQLRTHLLKVQVIVNGRIRGTFNMANFRRIAVFAGAGNDTVTIGLARPALLLGEEGNDRLTGHGGYDQIFGGPGRDILSGNAGDDFLFGEDGNDSLSGGSGNDVLVGGLGNDSLSGGTGRDLLIGGSGIDSQAGNAGDDILIGGTTVHDENRAALAQIMAGWTTRQHFHTRVNNLGPLLNSATVSDDGSRDRLDGSLERDWYIDYLLADSIVGFNSTQDRKN